MLAQRREDRRLHRPIQQRARPHCILEILDTPGGCRLSDMQANGRAIDGTGFREGDKGFDVGNVHNISA
jgi:hypothetical protein